MQHYILTRLNVDHRELAKLSAPHRGLDAEWLEHRVPLFERVCAPSVAGQQVDDFRWLVFVHPATPDPFRSRIEKAIGRAGGEVVWSETGSAEEVQQRLSGSGTLVTTRLDCDDALSRTHVASVRGAVEADRSPRLLNFRVGAQLHERTGVVVHTRHPSSPFLSYVESGDEPFTVWGFGSHVHVGDTPMQQLVSDGPAWLATIHDRNVANPRTLRPAMSRSKALAAFDIDKSLLAPASAVLRWQLELPLHRLRRKLRPGVVRRIRARWR